MREGMTKSNLREETIDKLQDLIAINVDSGKGFREAAELVEDPALQSFFAEQAADRSSFARELQVVVELNDEEPRDSGSIKAKFHRWWIGIRAAFSSDDRYAILAECERGEDAILALYKKLIVETAGSPVNDVLHTQLQSIKKSHDRVRDMRDVAKASK